MINEDLISENVDVSASQFADAILKCAYKCIPRGQVKETQALLDCSAD
jgi:hypothetical protein